MPRQARLDSPGTLHHVIIRGIEKKEIVADKHDRGKFIGLMGELAQKTNTSIYAWALMTNHAHILLKSGPYGLSHFMRRLLTRYAINFNNRHRRHGHLFQNRYKSIVCDEDIYFKELVRYIHLNPLRGKMVKNLSELDRYPWVGHSAIMGRRKREWQDVEYVLLWFGKRETRARKEYRQFVKNGIAEGKRADLVGGGLIRTLGGWSQVVSLHKNKEKVLSDERILGSNEFVERVINDSESHIKRQLSVNERIVEAEKKIRERCTEADVSVDELSGGSRRGNLPKIRAQLAVDLVQNYGLSLAEVGRQLGVSTSAISKIFFRTGKASRKSMLSTTPLFSIKTIPRNILEWS